MQLCLQSFFFSLLEKVPPDDLSLIESCCNGDTISWEDWSVRGGCFNIQWFQSGASPATCQFSRSAYVSMEVDLDKNRTTVAVLQTPVLTWILAHAFIPLVLRSLNMTPRLWLIATLRLSGNSPVMLPVLTTSQNRRLITQNSAAGDLLVLPSLFSVTRCAPALYSSAELIHTLLEKLSVLV